MQYMLLIYEDEGTYSGEGGAAAMADIVPRHGAFARELGDRLVSGAGLKGAETATTIRTAAGQLTVHDGPFAEAREQLGGFYIVDVPDLDAAMEIARRLPLTRDGAVEIRPVLQEDGAGGA